MFVHNIPPLLDTAQSITFVIRQHSHGGTRVASEHDQTCAVHLFQQWQPVQSGLLLLLSPWKEPPGTLPWVWMNPPWPFLWFLDLIPGTPGSSHKCLRSFLGFESRVSVLFGARDSFLLYGFPLVVLHAPWGGRSLLVLLDGRYFGCLN